MKNDVYINFLRRVEKTPISEMEIKNEFPNDSDWILREISRQEILTSSDDSKYHLSFSARFLLLEYDELNQARASSKSSTRYAIIAIIISIVTFLSSIAFSIIGMNSETKIDKRQFNKILEVYNVKSMKKTNEINKDINLEHIEMKELRNKRVEKND